MARKSRFLRALEKKRRKKKWVRIEKSLTQWQRPRFMNATTALLSMYRLALMLFLFNVLRSLIEIVAAINSLMMIGLKESLENETEDGRIIAAILKGVASE